MKKRHLIRLVCLVLLFALLLPTASASNQVQPRYQKINVITSELLSINWLGKATCCGSVTVLDDTCDVHLYVDLQRSEDGVNYWTTVKTWNTTGTWTVAIEKSHYVSSGYYYRVVTSAIIYDTNGNFIESDVISSAIFYH